MKAAWRAKLDAEFDIAPSYKPNKADWLDGRWSGLKAVREDRGRSAPRPDRRSRSRPCSRSASALTTVPEGFHVHRTIQRFLDNRKKMIETGEGIDWAMAEALAFGSLLVEGHRVRLSGQDCRARHLLAAPLRADRPGERGALHPAQPHPRGPGPLRGHQLDALGRGGARLRVRLHALRAERADAVGGAVRRFRQRRAGGVRPVHLVGRAQVAAHVRPRLPAAARL